MQLRDSFVTGRELSTRLLAVVAALANSPSRHRHVAHLRTKLLAATAQPATTALPAAMDVGDGHPQEDASERHTDARQSDGDSDSVGSGGSGTSDGGDIGAGDGTEAGVIRRPHGRRQDVGKACTRPAIQWPAGDLAPSLASVFALPSAAASFAPRGCKHLDSSCGTESLAAHRIGDDSASLLGRGHRIAPEAFFVDSVLDMLLGNTNPVFRLAPQPRDRLQTALPQYTLVAAFAHTRCSHLSQGSLTAMLQRFSEVGTMLERLAVVSAAPRGFATVEAFCVSVRHFVLEFRGRVMGLQHAERFAGTKHGAFGNESRPTLLALEAWLRPVRPTMSALWRCCVPVIAPQQHMPWVAAAVLTQLQCELQHACHSFALNDVGSDPDAPHGLLHIASLARSFVCTLVMYIKSNVERWVRDGAASAQTDFFVQQGTDGSNTFTVLPRACVPTVLSSRVDTVRALSQVVLACSRHS